MLWSRPPPQVRKGTDLKNKGNLMWMGSVGQELHHLEKERAIQTDPEETRRRRTIQLHRKDAESWGFTLQTYGIRNKRSHEVEVMTYVDYVELHGPAWIAGMRKGDVLLSVNGESVEGLNHLKLVEKIYQHKTSLRLVVLFEDCCRKVELYERYIRLKGLLSQKMRDLRDLEQEERKYCSGGRLSRVGVFRDSIRSSTSSDWDCYSAVTSPSFLDSVATNQRVWRQHFFARSIDTLDTTSELSLEYSSPFGSSRESLGAGTSRDSLTHKDSSSETAGDKSEPSAGATQSDGARNSCVENSSSEATKTDFYVEGEESDSDVATLRRHKERTSSESKPGTRARSNSTLLNDMRMILIAETVSAQASEASREFQAAGNGEAEEGDTEDDNDVFGVSDSEITVTVDEENVPYRMYRGVRINESDEVTRL